MVLYLHMLILKKKHKNFSLTLIKGITPQATLNLESFLIFLNSSSSFFNMESEIIILPLKSSVLIGSQKVFAMTLEEHNYSSFHTEVLKSP